MNNDFKFNNMTHTQPSSFHCPQQPQMHTNSFPTPSHQCVAMLHASHTSCNLPQSLQHANGCSNAGHQQSNQLIQVATALSNTLPQPWPVLLSPCQQFSMTQHHRNIIEWQCCRFWLQVATCRVTAVCNQLQQWWSLMIASIDQGYQTVEQANATLPCAPGFPCQQSSLTQHHLNIIEQRHYRLQLSVATCTNHCSMHPMAATMAITDWTGQHRPPCCQAQQCHPALWFSVPCQ